jgi:hypothetical protein
MCQNVLTQAEARENDKTIAKLRLQAKAGGALRSAVLQFWLVQIITATRTELGSLEGASVTVFSSSKAD